MCLAYDLDGTGFFEHGSNSSQKDRVIIGDQNGDLGCGDVVVQGVDLISRNSDRASRRQRSSEGVRFDGDSSRNNSEEFLTQRLRGAEAQRN